MSLKKKITAGLAVLAIGASALNGYAGTECSVPKVDLFQGSSPNDGVRYTNMTNHRIRSVASIYSGNAVENGVSTGAYNQSENPELFERALRDADTNGDCFVNHEEAGNLLYNALQSNEKSTTDNADEQVDNRIWTETPTEEYSNEEVVSIEESDDRAWQNYVVNDGALKGVAFLADVYAGRPVDVRYNGQNKLPYSIHSVSMDNFYKVHKPALSEALKRIDTSGDKHITKQDVTDYFVGNNILLGLEKADAYGNSNGTVTLDEIINYSERE